MRARLMCWQTHTHIRTPSMQITIEKKNGVKCNGHVQVYKLVFYCYKPLKAASFSGISPCFYIYIHSNARTLKRFKKYPTNVPISEINRRALYILVLCKKHLSKIEFIFYL